MPIAHCPPPPPSSLSVPGRDPCTLAPIEHHLASFSNHQKEKREPLGRSRHRPRARITPSHFCAPFPFLPQFTTDRSGRSATVRPHCACRESAGQVKNRPFWIQDEVNLSRRIARDILSPLIKLPRLAPCCEAWGAAGLIGASRFTRDRDSTLVARPFKIGTDVDDFC